MRRRSRLGAVLVVLAGALAVAGGGPAAAALRTAARDPVSLIARFDRGATLGSSTALDVTLRLDPRRLTTAPLTQISFAYPASLGVVSSGLGLATCTRPASDFARVLITAPPLGGCSPNAVMGLGSAIALVRLNDGEVIREYASMTLLSGPLERGHLGLVVYVDGIRPFGAKLAFAGDVTGAPAPYGGALSMRMPEVPGIEDLATISLVEMRIAIGSHAIRYYERRHGRRVAYHPEGVALPTACPPGGFRFQARIGFADGSRAAGRAVTPCPPPVASARAPR